MRSFIICRRIFFALYYCKGQLETEYNGQGIWQLQGRKYIRKYFFVGKPEGKIHSEFIRVNDTAILKQILQKMSGFCLSLNRKQWLALVNNVTR